MSVRDYPVLWLGATKGSGNAATAGGGNVLLKTPAHHLDGAEHLATSDNTDLDVSTTAHGLMPKLSGSATDVLLGDGTYGAPPTPDPVDDPSVWVPLMTTAPNIVTTDGANVYVVVTSGGSPVMVLVPR